MELNVFREGPRTVVAVEGRLNTNTAPKLDAVVRDLHQKGNIDLVVDLAACGYVSSAGLRVVVAMQKRSLVRGSLSFRNVGPDVMQTFRNVGFDDILTFE